MNAGNERKCEAAPVTCSNACLANGPCASVLRQSLKSPTISVGRWADSRKVGWSSKYSACQCRSRSASPRCQLVRCSDPSGVSTTTTCAPRGCASASSADKRAVVAGKASATIANCHTRLTGNAHSFDSKNCGSANGVRSGGVDRGSDSGAHCLSLPASKSGPDSHVRSPGRFDPACNGDRHRRCPCECCS